MKRIGKSVPASIAAVALALLAVAGCGTATAGGATFAGYKWRIAAIDRGGRETPIPARYNVYLKFAPNGDFGGNEPVNYHSGTYHLVNGGFTTNTLAITLAGYMGKDPIVLLAVGAISAFDPGVHATATVAGNRLKITVGSYLLDCQRDGRIS